MKQVTIRQTADILRTHNNYVILTHRRPDGDTLGSAAALCSALRRMGKRAVLLRNGGATERYLPYCERFFTRRGFQISNEYIITVDVASLNMLGDRLPQRIDLAIDHHSSNTMFGENVLLDGTASACGEIILEVIKALCGNVTQEEANALYVALSTDTGCFQYGNTNAASFRAAAQLCDYGAEIAKINLAMFRTFSPARIKVEASLMSNLITAQDGKVQVAVLTRELINSFGATEEDVDDMASLPGKVAGTQVGVLIKENDKGFAKLSLRSTGEVNVSEICAKFGGGGHAMAAGCELEVAPMDAVPVILEAIGEAYK